MTFETTLFGRRYIVSIAPNGRVTARIAGLGGRCPT